MIFGYHETVTSQHFATRHYTKLDIEERSSSGNFVTPAKFDSFSKRYFGWIGEFFFLSEYDTTRLWWECLVQTVFPLKTIRCLSNDLYLKEIFLWKADKKLLEMMKQICYKWDFIEFSLGNFWKKSLHLVLHWVKKIFCIIMLDTTHQCWNISSNFGYIWWCLTIRKCLRYL